MVDFSLDVDGRRSRVGKKSGKYVSISPQRMRGQGRYSVGKHYPKPYPFTKFTWSKWKPIATTPAVQGGNITSGPQKTLSPSRVISIDEGHVSSNRGLMCARM